MVRRRRRLAVVAALGASSSSSSSSLLVGALRLSLPGTTVRFEAYEGRLSLQWDVRFDAATAPRLEPGAVDIRSAGAKGRGSFAAGPIAEGTFLGAYPGEALSAAAFAARYKEADPAYVIRVDSDCYLDASGLSRADDFAPHLMNHAAPGAANVVRYVAAHRPPLIHFFTDRPVGRGEELAFDYGPQFWRGRNETAIDAPL